MADATACQLALLPRESVNMCGVLATTKLPLSKWSRLKFGNDEMKFPAIIKTVSMFMLLLFSLLLKNCTPDIYKGLFESESDVFNKRKKEHAKEGVTCAMPFLLLQIQLLSSRKQFKLSQLRKIRIICTKNLLLGLKSL